MNQIEILKYLEEQKNNPDDYGFDCTLYRNQARRKSQR